MLKFLSFTDAAEKVLKEYAHKKPMHYKEIIRLALKNKWISTKGLTPETTLTASIGSENRRRQARGEEARFIAHGKGMYGLSMWEPKGLAKEIQQKNKEEKRKLQNILMTIKPRRFEELIGELLAETGFENVEVTTKHGDGGIDVKGDLIVGGVIKTKMAVQVKRWKNNVQVPVVTQLRGSLEPHEQGLIITTSDFSKGAVKEASDPRKAPISLMNGTNLIELMAECQIGIKKTDLFLLEIDKEPLSNMGITEEQPLPDQIKIFGTTKGRTYKGILIGLKKVKVGRKTYSSPSGAAKAICGYSVDGWRFWKYKESKTGKVSSIDKLRKK